MCSVSRVGSYKKKKQIFEEHFYSVRGENNQFLSLNLQMFLNMSVLPLEKRETSTKVGFPGVYQFQKKKKKNSQMQRTR